MGNPQTVEQVIGVGRAELLGVCELGVVGVQVVVLLDGLHHVAFALHFEHLLGDNNMSVVHVHQEVAEVSIGSVQIRRVAEGTLVVGHWPGGRAHYSQVVVPVRVQTCR